MAKYNVKHSCGHVVEHQLYGKIKDRYKRIEWLETQICPDCKAAEAAKANADLPRLSGSAKQIAWAEQIRQPVIAKITQIKNNIKISKKATKYPKRIDFLVDTIDEIINQTAASYWIDNRAMLADKNFDKYNLEIIAKEKLDGMGLTMDDLA